MTTLHKVLIKKILLLFIYSVIFLLFACSKDDTDTVRHDGKNLEINLSLPGPLAEPIEGLQAYVTLNGGLRTELTINTIDNTASGRVPNVPVGTYELKLVYFKEIAGIDTVLANFSTTISVSKGQTTNVAVTDDELDRNIDDDGDGYTNLAEVRINTDPHDKFSSPGTPPGFSVGHGSYGDQTATSYTMKSIAGEALSGSATSTNFQVTAGFTSY